MQCKCVKDKEKFDIYEYLVSKQLSSGGYSKKFHEKVSKKNVRKFNFPNRAIE